MKNSMKNALRFSLAFGLLSAAPALAQDSCTYTDWAWNVETKSVSGFREISTTRHNLTKAQIHPDLPCSICREDMEEVFIGDLKPVLMCHIVAGAVEDALNLAAEQGFEIETLTGYRVGRTKGPVDGDGLRTEYSHHSFGLAIDINAELNGLYGNCFEFGPDCRLRRGGEWQPGTPGTITKTSPAYDALQPLGFKWGGELYGRQKDFMHFSLSGD